MVSEIPDVLKAKILASLNQVFVQFNPLNGNGNQNLLPSNSDSENISQNDNTYNLNRQD